MRINKSESHTQDKPREFKLGHFSHKGLIITLYTYPFIVLIHCILGYYLDVILNIPIALVIILLSILFFIISIVNFVIFLYIDIKIQNLRIKYKNRNF